MYIIIIYKLVFYKGISHWWFTSKIDNFIWKYSCHTSPVTPVLFFSVIWYCFLFLVVTLMAATFNAQKFLNCSNFFWWMIKLYLLFVPSLKWGSILQIEIRKQCRPQNNLFHQVTMQQYWVYRLILILIQSHDTRHGRIFNIAKLYPFFLLSYLNSDVLFALHLEYMSMEI